MTFRSRFAAIKTYPYTNARVRAMRADLITDQEYRKLTKMGLSQVAEFLSKRGYQDEIELFGADYEGAELLERSLKHNFARTVTKLLRVSPPDVEALLRLYYHKFELQNIKSVLRRLKRDPEADIAAALFPTPEMDEATRSELLQQTSIEAVLDYITVPDIAKAVLGQVDENSSLQVIEDALDHAYYQHLSAEAERIGHSTLFKNFLQLEVALKNINLVLRMKRRGYDYSEIADRLIDMETTRLVDVHDLAAADTYEDAVNLLAETTLSAHLSEVDTDSPAQVERALERYKLERGILMLHRDQLSANPILGFMICKEIQFSNLRMIVRAKEEELGTEFIDHNLLTGVAR